MRQQSRHLSAFILLLLADKPLHGGAVQTTLKTELPKLKADSAAVYRALHQLEKEGQVTTRWNLAKSGPPLKLYAVTPAGWRKLDFWRQDIEGRVETLNRFLKEYRRLKKKR